MPVTDKHSLGKFDNIMNKNGRNSKLSSAQVLQGILNLYTDPRYLEIGVFKGNTFHSLDVCRKTAVDPKFQFDISEMRKTHTKARYFEIPSDQYFGSIITANERFDVIFIDGMHTAEQTLRDMLNAMSFLAARGVIVMDDVIPCSYAASLTDQHTYIAVKEGLDIKSNARMGDVYKLVFFIETFCQQWDYRTICDNRGQVVLWRAERSSVPYRDIESIGRLPYSSVIYEEDAYKKEYYKNIIDLLLATTS